MANITPQMVKSLREKTGAGMSDCQKALKECDGDMEAAVDFLRKKGAASAAKRADRESKEGAIVVRTSNDNKTAIIAEVNSETDFVAKNEGFVNYTITVGNAMLGSDAESVDDLMKVAIDGLSMLDHHNGILAKYGEKIEVRRVKRLKTTGSFDTYIHFNKSTGVIVEINCSNLTEKAKELLHDITLQVFSMKAEYIDKSEVTAEKLEKEREIYLAQALEEGKKPEIAEKMAVGRIEKYFKEFCLMQQEFFKDSKKTIADVVAEISGECGCDAKILSFTRWTLGDML